MRTLIFIVGGFVLLAVCLGAAKLLSGGAAHGMRTATIAFVALWLVVAGGNMWIGVAIFGLPVVVAVLLKWKIL